MTMSKENKKLLYHYTTMNTFYSMIDHSLVYEKNDINPTYITMWATHYAYQNDPTECQFFFEGLQNRILNYAKTKKVELTDEDKQLIKQPWYGLNIYTISLSTQEDDLTMWRGYGQNGDGISLGFDFSKLPSTLPIYGPDCKEREYRSESDPTYLLTRNIRECKYIDPNNIEIVEVRTPSGRVDMVLRTATHLYLFELKLNKDADAAMKQINLKEYPKRFALSGLPIVKVGVNFDVATHNITDWKIEAE